LQVETGDLVKISYVGKFEDGEVFDTSIEEIAKENNIYVPEREYAPISIIAGIGQVIEGLDKALMGMKIGDEKKVVIPPEEAYGEVIPELIQKVPLQIFKDNNIEPKEGMHITTNHGIARVTSVGEEEVELDFNHPLAGKTLVFEIKVEDIVKK